MPNIRSGILNAHLKEFEKCHNKALDWLIISWEKKGEEKVKALLEYKKWKKMAFAVAYKLDKYTNG